jgi:hypothetical protein
MSINPLWHLHDFLSVFSASALIAGYDPTVITNEKRFTNDNFFSESYPELDTIEIALSNAITAGTLSIHTCESDINGNEYNHLIKLDELKRWLVSRGFTSGFLFEGDNINKDDPDYLNPSHPRYAPKLAASVKAWLSTSDTQKKPKEALEKWLRENAAAYGLNKDDGNPNELGIEECTKVANWNTKGGATKTPVKNNHTTIKDNLPTPTESPKMLDLDDDIPYRS